MFVFVCVFPLLPPSSLLPHTSPSRMKTSSQKSLDMVHRRLPLWAVALVSAALVGGVAGEAKPTGVPTISQILVGSRNPQAGGSEVFVLGHNLTGTASCSEAECRKRVQVRPWDPRSALAPHAYCLRSPFATARALSPSSASRLLSPYRPFSPRAYRSHNNFVQ